MNFSGATLLLLEDEPLLRKQIAAHLEQANAAVTSAKTLAEARQALAHLEFDYALLDVSLPDGRSLSLLETKAIPGSTVTVIMTAEGGISGAIEAMRLGAADYLVKPFDLAELEVRLARARRDRQARRQQQRIQDQRTTESDAFVFGGALSGVKTQLERIIAADRRLIAGAPPPVLLEGETGTGKTTLARWIHAHGPRADGPLIELNCSALTETLAESELFGHERGAFTDAKEARIGLIEAADGGTLFLDELPSLSPGVQAKLLKAIEDRAIRRLGSSRVIPVDCRIIAATNANLRDLVDRQLFREDLLQRLDLFRVRIPPLRERGDDLSELAHALAARIARNYGLAVRPIPPAGLARLRRHPWRGNVRELAHEIERSLVFDLDGLSFTALASSAATPANASEPWLQPNYRFPDSGFVLESAIDVLIKRALEHSDGNLSAAARLLGVTRDFIRYRVKSPAVPAASASPVDDLGSTPPAVG